MLSTAELMLVLARQVVVMAFECSACNYTSNEVQNAADIAPRGVHYILNVGSRNDLDRQVIKSAHATIRLPEIDFEIPPTTQSGSLSTVEGVLAHAAKSLEFMQPQRRAADLELYHKVQSIIDDLRLLAAGGRPFVFTMDDPSVNESQLWCCQSLCCWMTMSLAGAELGGEHGPGITRLCSHLPALHPLCNSRYGVWSCRQNFGPHSPSLGCGRGRRRGAHFQSWWGGCAVGSGQDCRLRRRRGLSRRVPNGIARGRANISVAVSVVSCSRRAGSMRARVCF